MANPIVDYLAILKTLRSHGVDFVVVGGVCAVLHGAPLATFDLDVVHSREPHNLARLMAALEELHVHYRIPGRRDKKPGPSHLASAGHQLLMTLFGPLDLLGTIGQGHDYGQLLHETVEVEIGGGLKVRVLSLERLVKTKEETGQEKDKAVLPVLRRLLEERSKS
jgi:predicted nucleotidyltransferase